MIIIYASNVVKHFRMKKTLSCKHITSKISPKNVNDELVNVFSIYWHIVLWLWRESFKSSFGFALLGELRSQAGCFLNHFCWWWHVFLLWKRTFSISHEPYCYSRRILFIILLSVTTLPILVRIPKLFPVPALRFPPNLNLAIFLTNSLRGII